MTTFYVRPLGEQEPITEHPTDGDAAHHAEEMSADGRTWIVIRKRGRLSQVIRRYPDGPMFG